MSFWPMDRYHISFTDATEKLIMNKVANKRAYIIKGLKFKSFTVSHQNIYANKKNEIIKFNFLTAKKLPYFGYKFVHKNGTY